MHHAPGYESDPVLPRACTGGRLHSPRACIRGMISERTPLGSPPRPRSSSGTASAHRLTSLCPGGCGSDPSEQRVSLGVWIGSSKYQTLSCDPRCSRLWSRRPRRPPRPPGSQVSNKRGDRLSDPHVEMDGGDWRAGHRWGLQDAPTENGASSSQPLLTYRLEKRRSTEAVRPALAWGAVVQWLTSMSSPMRMNKHTGSRLLQTTTVYLG
ncbi:hypothetical protein F4802DRAFT_43851 [Xylaria palmicola]|nr:hypothetical protein F4802DRAFT_43851 [Xylaria palmicola]